MIDRDKLQQHLQGLADELRQRIEQPADDEVVMMRYAKQIVLTQLLDDLERGKFDQQE